MTNPTPNPTHADHHPTTPQLLSVNRTGREPLTFIGHVILVKAGRETGWKRKHAITIFHAMPDRYVTQIEFLTGYEREVSTSWVRTSDTRAGILDALLAYEPIADLIGYPDGEQFTRKQIRLEQELVLKYDELMSEVARELNITEKL